MNNGARFLRADLHIHSYGKYGSFDVADSSNTPMAIVDTAIKNGLNIISITDHNQIRNSEEAIDYSQSKEIKVIPGVELSTIQGHLLVYFETFDLLSKFYGKLTFNDEYKVCNNGIVECLNFANEFKGFGVLAHIDLPSGFEKTVNKFGPIMEEIFKCENLLGLEISTLSSVNLYTNEDTSIERKNLLAVRKKHLKYTDDYELPKLIFSDSHSIERIGENADGKAKITRIKVDEPNFHSIEIALLTSSSRIRLEDLIPYKHPTIKSIKIEGGLFENAEIELNPNLNCIIGTRGAGKSTLLESVREASGNSNGSKLVDCEIWPQNIILKYQDETNQIIDFEREKNGDTRNITDPLNGISKIEIESYGQGQTAETIQHCDEDPSTLIKFLDTFLDIESLVFEEEEVIKKLRANRSDSIKLRLDLALLDETKRFLNNEKTKLKNLEQEKAGEVVKLHSALITEDNIRNNLIEKLNELIKKYKNILNDEEVFENIRNISEEDIIVGKDNLKNVKNIVSGFETILTTKSTELNSELTIKISELKDELKKWKENEGKIKAEIEEKKKRFETMGIPFDTGKINQISKDIIEYGKRLKILLDKQKALTELQEDRKNIITERINIKKEIYKKRLSFAFSIEKNLKNTMDGLLVSVKYDEGKYSDEFEIFIKDLMGWRTSQVPKSKIISKSISPLDFSELCKNGKVKELKSILNSKEENFSEQEISSIITKVKEDLKYEDIESLAFEDKPTITVTRCTEDSNGNIIHKSREFSQLSLGQQQSVLLAILLLSKSTKPLIIDQPEDNLDSEFIFKTIVKNLRKVKESRQVIIVTHNPNIAVLGDAEYIIPLKSTSVKTHIIDSGSIDKKETRSLCCEILEGGESAFNQRKLIYGF